MLSKARETFFMAVKPTVRVKEHPSEVATRFLEYIRANDFLKVKEMNRQFPGVVSQCGNIDGMELFPLSLALLEKHEKMIKCLLNEGASVTAFYKRGFDSLHTTSFMVDSLQDRINQYFGESRGLLEEHKQRQVPVIALKNLIEHRARNQNIAGLVDILADPKTKDFLAIPVCDGEVRRDYFGTVYNVPSSLSLLESIQRAYNEMPDDARAELMRSHYSRDFAFIETSVTGAMSKVISR